MKIKEYIKTYFPFIIIIIYLMIIFSVLYWYYLMPSGAPEVKNINYEQDQSIQEKEKKEYKINNTIKKNDFIEDKHLYPEIDVNYTELMNQNKDFVGVIYIPSLEIQYPVAKSADDKEYLDISFDGTKDKRGCIFLEKSMAVDFSLPNTFIYGHNMKNGEMFGSLKQFLSNEELCIKDPYIYIYTGRQVYTYKIFSYYTVSVNDNLYRLISYDEYEDYYKKAIEKSMYKKYDKSIDFTEKPRLLTLSTCYGTGHKKNFVVHGALERIEKIK